MPASRSFARLAVAALVAIGAAAHPQLARADVPPGPGEPHYVCQADGKPCETCDVFVGDPDAGATCGQEKSAKGFSLACENDGASNRRQYWCPAGTTVEKKDVAADSGGCSAGGGGGSRASFGFGVAAALGIAAALRSGRGARRTRE